MKRLPFRLPEWSPRMTWTSAEAQTVWAPRMARVSSAIVEAERQAVITGVKPSALQAISPDSLGELSRQMAAHSLVVIPLGKMARALTYTSASQPLAPDDPFDFRVAITPPRNLELWSKAWGTNDNEAIGMLLGYPSCCREFFERVWVNEHWFDTTGPMAAGREWVRGTNMLLRWFGVRPVSHLPCAFDCEPTRLLAGQMLALLPSPEREWAEAMLSWPTRWSSLHGVAEIFTPVFRAEVPTDALAEPLEVKYLGIGYPEEGATGLVFPYRSTPIVIARPALKNGFVTTEAMDAAHAVLLQALAGRSFETVIDLGCGDGALLRKVSARRRVGVEQDLTVTTDGLDRTVYMDCTDMRNVKALLLEERPELVIAQRHRNPLSVLPCTCDVLSYSYEGGTTAKLIRGRVAV